jgi:thiosulfate/3-mercaptopyruvate sulfurtransferase
MKKIALVAALVFGITAPAIAGEARTTTAAWIAAHLADKNLVILHTGDKAEYQAGHIPGAQFVQPADLATAGADGLSLELPSAGELRTKLQDLGISNRSKIVVAYGKDSIHAAARIVFTLDAAGLGNRTRLLDGGLAEWTRAGHATTDLPPSIRVGDLGPVTLRSRIVDAAFIQSHANNSGYVVLDARGAEFFDGKKAGAAQGTSLKSGHIPGAKNLPYTTLMTPDAKLKNRAQILAAFAAAGVKPGNRVVVYCNVGQQASALMFAADMVGIDAVLYDGSLQDWTKRDLPVETSAAK